MQDCLPEVFFELFKLTFMNLSETKLLQRCVRGATQNRNECINSMVRVPCPKHKYHGVKVVCCSVAFAVCHFHSYAASRESIMKRLSKPAGEFTIRPLGLRKREEAPAMNAEVGNAQRRSPVGD